MPYEWNQNPGAIDVLTLRAHRSLPQKGFAGVILGLSGFLGLPLLALLGTPAVWGMLPFFAIAVWALWIALRRSYKDGEVSEVLMLEGDTLRLSHRPAKGEEKVWECNVYWARLEVHESRGPVPHYITLSSRDRTVEIGRFLSEDERRILSDELQDFLVRCHQPKPPATNP